MAESSVFSDTILTDYISNGSYYNDAGNQVLTLACFYRRANDPDVWITKVRFFALPDSPIVGDPLSLMIWPIGGTNSDPSFDNGNVVGWAQRFDFACVAGWNDFVLDVPIKLPADSSPTQKIVTGIFNPNGDYMAAGFMGTSAFGNTVGSTLVYFSENDSFATAAPQKAGYFRYGPLTETDQGNGPFNFWNGTDIWMTDVPPTVPEPTSLPFYSGTDEIVGLRSGEEEIIAVHKGLTKLWP